MATSAPTTLSKSGCLPLTLLFSWISHWFDVPGERCGDPTNDSIFGFGCCDIDVEVVHSSCRRLLDTQQVRSSTFYEPQKS